MSAVMSRPAADSLTGSASHDDPSVDELDAAICRLVRQMNAECYRMLMLVRDFDDRFGWALAAGDFDGDGRGDLAVGHPGEDVINVNTGGVTILMGATGTGLIGRFRFLSAGLASIPGNSQSHQDFGRALAVGDFDGSGFSDLAIGAPYYDASGVVDVGGEAVIYGALFADGFEVGSTSRWSSTAN